MRACGAPGARGREAELENISCGCLLACSLADYAKKRARETGASKVLRFFGEGRDRALLDALHEANYSDLKNFRPRRLVAAAARHLAGRFRKEQGAACTAFWDHLRADFIRDYKAGRIYLFEIDWE